MKTAAAVLVLGLTGAVLFLAGGLGPGVVDPTAVDWLFGPGDWGQHYLGWATFRQAPWSLPLGYNPMLLWPMGTSIVYTDSLPLLAIPLKLFDGVLPASFQFNGLWMFTAWVLQPVMAFVLLRRVSVDHLTACAGALLFLLIPSMTARIGHDTLVAQWILLWALVVVTRPRTAATDLHFLAVLIVAALVHFYLLFMALALWAAWVAPGVLSERTVRGATLSAGRAAGVLAGVVGVMWLAGYFVIAVDSAAGGGFGHYSMNLNAPLNPVGEHWSTLVPHRPVGPGQYEGFQYLGVGIMALLLVAAGLVASNPRHAWARVTPDRRPVWQRRRWWLLAALATLTVLAVSDTVTWDETVLFTYNLPDSLTSMVRSSGRLWWPVPLAALAGAVVLLHRMVPRRWALAVIAVCLVLQWIDVRHGVLTGPPPAAHPSRLEDDRWAELVDAARVVSVVPSDTMATEVLYPLTHLAARAGVPITAAYVARRDHARLTAANARLIEAIVRGDTDPDTLYVQDATAESGGAALSLLSAPHVDRLGLLDGLFVLPPEGNDGRPLPAAPAFPFDRVMLLDAPSLASLVAGCAADCSLILAVKDEASTNLPSAFIQAMSQRGSRLIGELGWRQSYAAILHDGAVLAEDLASDAPVSLAATLGGLRFTVESAGNAAGSWASISTAGRQLALNRRGFNVVRIHWDRRAIEVGTIDVFAGKGE